MNVSTKLVIVGCGETAALAHEYFTVDSPYEVVAFCVERDFISQASYCDLPVVPLDELTTKFPPSRYMTFVALSSTKLNRPRTKLFQLVRSFGYSCANYVSSNAFVWRNVTMGQNCLIMENNVLQPFVSLGDNVVMWSGNHIGHRSVIEDHCFISSHVVVSGFCRIGRSCFLGVNATVSNNLTIGSDCFIGAGAVIQRDTGNGEVYQVERMKAAKVDTKRLFQLKDEVTTVA